MDRCQHGMHIDLECADCLAIENDELNEQLAAAREEIEWLHRNLEIAQAGRDAFVKRAEAAERERDEYRDSQRFWHEKASLLAQDVARAERLAEAVESRMYAHPMQNAWTLEQNLREALAAYRPIQLADLCPRHDLGHEFAPCAGTPDDPCLAAPESQPAEYVGSERGE